MRAGRDKTAQLPFRVGGPISVRFRLLVAVFLIFVIPVSILLGVTHSIMSGNQRQRVLQEYRASFQDSTQAIESMTSELYTFAHRMGQTVWFKKLLHAQPGSDLYTGRDSYELYMYNDQLFTYAMLGGVFDNIIIYLPERDYILSSMGVLYQPELPDRLFKVLTMTDEEWRMLSRTREDMGFTALQRVRQNGAVSQGALFKFAFPIEATSSVRAVMIVYVRMDRIGSCINEALLAAGSVLTVRFGDKLLYSHGETEKLDGWAASDELGFHYASDADERMRYDNANLHVELRLPGELLRTEGLSSAFLAIYALCLLVGLLLAWIVSDLFYRPLNRILRKLGQGAARPVALQAQEYKLIESEIAKIVRQEGDLRDRLDLQRPILLNAVFDMLIHERYVPDVQMEKMLELLRVSFPHERFGVAVLAFEHQVDRLAAETIIRRQRGAQLDMYYVWNGDALVVISNVPSDAEHLEALGRVSQQLRAALGDGFICCAGLCGGDMACIVESHNQAEAARERAYWRAPCEVVEYTPQPSPAKPEPGSMERVRDLICSGQAELATAQLWQQLSRLRACACASAEARRILEGWYGELALCAERARLSFNDERSRPRSLCFALDEQRLVDMASRMAQAVLSQIDQVRESYVQRLTEYVDANLCNHDLSLTLLAEEFGYTVSYVSKLFKDTLDRNFLDYVMERRIEKAKAKLEGGAGSISEIAQSVGFNSDISFRRQFKRYAGMTPSHYRAIHGWPDDSSDEQEE